ncbi:MAG TPA: biotin synthase BioB [Phycisphaerae bacterium]|nr:biotin synthase BioB [Phycisphaerae bacterium]
MQVRHDWTRDDIRAVYDKPFPELLFEAATIHRRHFDPTRVQRSTLLSVKTGGCPENCAYCPQSAHYDTGVEKHGVLPKAYVLEKARAAQAEGSTRFCMGAAWREVKDGKDFDAVLELVESVAATGMEVCCTLGMLTESQARRLKDAGCHAYNHNLDTSPEFYGSIITTRTYDDRLRTLRHVRAAGITVCCGGIIGMGETIDDRLGLLEQLARQNPHPESVPINALQRVDGTPLGEREAVDPLEFVRMVATARILMPASYVRLSAGRIELSDEAQALCFLAGANSIFAGDKLLTQKNPGEDRDRKLLGKLGMQYVERPCAAEQAPARAETSAARTQHLMVSR